MKNFIVGIDVLIMTSMFLFGCSGQSPCKTLLAHQSGKEDMAYLLFVSPKECAGKEVTVSLDNQKPFTVKVVKEKSAKRKGTQYGVKIGPRSIKVTSGSKTLYQKKIFCILKGSQTNNPTIIII